MALIPRPWRLAEDPRPWLAAALLSAEPQPLLLLLDCREPLDPDRRAALEITLAAGERQRLAALVRPRDRLRFLLARSGLRMLLAAWGGQVPQAVAIGVGPHGKPFCPGGPAFNISHSGELILLALHRHHAVGVDVERHRPGLDWQPLADRWLPQPQRLALQALPPGQRLAGFLQAWCQLEARLKAHGCGLAGLEQLRQQRAADLACPVERLRDVELPQGYHGALAWLEPGPPG